MTAASVSLACRNSPATARVSSSRRSSDCAMQLKLFASAPTSSWVRTALRWLSSPAASTDASLPSCRNGRTMRPDSIQAMAKAAANAQVMNSTLQPSRRATATNAISVGSPTETSHGTAYAVEEPVIRLTPSGQTATSLISFAVRWRATISNSLRSRPIHLAASTLRAITIPSDRRSSRRCRPGGP